MPWGVEDQLSTALRWYRRHLSVCNFDLVCIMNYSLWNYYVWENRLNLYQILYKKVFKKIIKGYCGKRNVLTVQHYGDLLYIDDC